MPFTPSHAVVALPFIRSPLVPAAIAVGAMTPDLLDAEIKVAPVVDPRSDWFTRRLNVHPGDTLGD